MCEEIGEKIKYVSVSIRDVGILVSGLVGIASIVLLPGTTGKIAGAAIISLGSLFSWLLGLFLQGFGELINKISNIADNIQQMNIVADRLDREFELSKFISEVNIVTGDGDNASQ